MPGQPLFEVMSAQATSALVNGAPQGGGTQTAGYGSAESGPAEPPAAVRPQERSGAEQSEQTAVPPTTSDVNGPEVPSSSNHLEGAGRATEGVLPASSGESGTRDGFPELQSGMRSSAQRAETATGLLDAMTSPGLPDVGEDPGEFGVNRGFFYTEIEDFSAGRSIDCRVGLLARVDDTDRRVVRSTYSSGMDAEPYSFSTKAADSTGAKVSGSSYC